MKEIKKKTLQGVKWTFLQDMSSQLISFVVFLILARLLQPQDFGLVAMASAFLAFLGPFITQGFGAAIVQRETVDREHLDTAFWLNLLIGLVFTTGGVLAAPLVAKLFKEPGLAPVFAALSLNFLVLSLTSVQQAIVRRDMKFKLLAVRTIGAQTVAGAVGVTMALTGYGVWALVARQLVESFVSLLLLWRLSDWRPSFRFSGRHFKDLYGFGMHIMGSELFTMLNRRADNLLIGYFLGAVALGYYTVAYRLLKIMYSLISKATTKVGMPAFARLQSDPERVKRAFYRMSEITALAAFPSFLGLLVLAPELVPNLFGSQWEPSIPVMQVLCLVGIIHCLLRPNVATIVGLGRADWRFRLQVIDGLVTVTAFFVAVKWGIVAVAIAYTIAGYVQAPLWFWAVERLVPISTRGYLSAIRAPLISVSLMLLGIVAVKWSLEGYVPVMLQISAAVAAGALLYLVSIYGLFPQTANKMGEVLRVFKPRSGRKER